MSHFQNEVFKKMNYECKKFHKISKYIFGKNRFLDVFLKSWDEVVNSCVEPLTICDEQMKLWDEVMDSCLELISLWDEV